MKQILLAAFTILFIFTLNSAKAQSQEEMQKWMDYMTPSDVHKMMAKWDGEWTEDIEMTMDPAAPMQKMTATCVNKMILGGRYQESKHTGSFNGMPFEGISLVAWDNVRKKFVSTWIDNFGTGVMYMEGDWDNAAQTIILKGKMTDPMTGNEADIKQTMKIVDDNTQIMEQFNYKDGKEFKSMSITFKRKK
ncbi:MAG TPA: DUF1579 domain-containing protein [Chitinophagaceae bacterium]|nr:DUF1579 domain-containing protein [Chitinophagaceae bacterium]